MGISNTGNGLALTLTEADCRPTNAKAVSRQDLNELLFWRWNVELEPWSIKAVMHMDMLPRNPTRHVAERNERLLTGVELDHWKADCRERLLSLHYRNAICSVPVSGVTGNR